jgi:hypothetical protein
MELGFLIFELYFKIEGYIWNIKIDTRKYELKIFISWEVWLIPMNNEDYYIEKLILLK